MDSVEVAQHATDEFLKAEIYLASLVGIDEQNFMEKAYLDELARQALSAVE